MTPPDPTPRVPGGGPRPKPRPERPTKSRAPRVVVRYDTPLPPASELKALGVTDQALEGLQASEAGRVEAAATLAADRGLAAGLAKGEFSSLARVSSELAFRLPAEAVKARRPADLQVDPDAAARGILAEALAAASASGAAWRAFCTDPQPAITQAAAAYDFALVRGGEAARDSVAADALAAARWALRITPTVPGQQPQPGLTVTVTGG